METDFAAAVASWEEFYETIAGAAGTLMGLLFVSLAINPKMMSDAGPDARRIWSEQTFHSFLVLLVIAIVALIPDQTPAGLGIPLLIVGGQGLIKAFRDARTALRARDPEWRDARSSACSCHPCWVMPCACGRRFSRSEAISMPWDGWWRSTFS